MMYAHVLDFRFSHFQQPMPKQSRKIFCGVEGTRLNCNLYKSKAENADKSSNHEFWRKMVSLVAITYTSPKVSVTANKWVPRKKKQKRVLGASTLKYVSNQLNIS